MPRKPDATPRVDEDELGAVAAGEACRLLDAAGGGEPARDASRQVVLGPERVGDRLSPAH